MHIYIHKCYFVLEAIFYNVKTEFLKNAQQNITIIPTNTRFAILHILHLQSVCICYLLRMYINVHFNVDTLAPHTYLSTQVIMDAILRRTSDRNIRSSCCMASKAYVTILWLSCAQDASKKSNSFSELRELKTFGKKIGVVGWGLERRGVVGKGGDWRGGGGGVGSKIV